MKALHTLGILSTNFNTPTNSDSNKKINTHGSPLLPTACCRTVKEFVVLNYAVPLRPYFWRVVFWGAMCYSSSVLVLHSARLFSWVRGNQYQSFTNTACTTCASKTLDHCYSPIGDSYKAFSRLPLGKSDPTSILLLPSYRQKLKQEVPVVRSIQSWSDQLESMLQDCFWSHGL